MLLRQELSVAAGRRMLAAITGFSHRYQYIQNYSQRSVARQSLVSSQSLLRSSDNYQYQPVRSVSFQDDPSAIVRHDPRKGELVYVGTLTRLVRLVKLFSLSTSAVGISLQPFLYEQVSNLHWALATMVGGVAGFFVFVTPVLLHIVTKRYVTAMFLNRENGVFTATTYNFFIREKEHSFTAEDVKTPTVPGIFTTVKIKDKTPLFIDPNLFIDRKAYIQMMKYDEPMDWEIPEQAEAKKSSE